MTDYTKATNFASKDSLSSGNALKIVKGTEIDTEFNNIQTSIATKADLTSPSFTGTPSLPTGATGITQSYGNSSTSLATTAFVQAALAAIYPVGSIYTNATVSTNPATLLGFGTWTAFGAGRVMAGFNASNALFDTAEKTGGSADSIVVSHTHSATVNETPHSHGYLSNTGGSTGISPASQNSGNPTGNTTGTAVTGITVTNASTGSSGTNANYAPFITVYMWKRTA
jgi:hypothetical protein